MDCIIGVDLGGTEIKMGKFYGLELIEKYCFKTDVSDNGSHIIDDICKYVHKIVEDDNLVGLGIGVPAPVRSGYLYVAPNLGWKDMNIKEILQSRFPKTIIAVGNDANIAALGEKANGGAKDFESYVLVTLGTGIGGGVVVDGNLIEGSTGGGGEIGHMCVVPNGRLCGCGLKGCIERYASATGMVITANEMRQNRETKLNEGDITAKRIFDLAKQNDEVAIEVVEDMTSKLATTLTQIAQVVNPEAFVIGGGVSKAGDYLLDKISKKFNDMAFHPQKGTKFVLAKLGNDAGIYGACYAAYNLLNK